MLYLLLDYMTVHTYRRDLSALQGLEKFYISMYSSLSRYVVDPQGFSGRNDLVRDWRCKRRLLYIHITESLGLPEFSADLSMYCYIRH